VASQGRRRLRSTIEDGDCDCNVQNSGGLTPIPGCVQLGRVTFAHGPVPWLGPHSA